MNSPIIWETASPITVSRDPGCDDNFIVTRGLSLFKRRVFSKGKMNGWRSLSTTGLPSGGGGEGEFVSIMTGTGEFVSSTLGRIDIKMMPLDSGAYCSTYPTLERLGILLQSSSECREERERLRQRIRESRNVNGFRNHMDFLDLETASMSEFEKRSIATVAVPPRSNSINR
jgi:hypothetical protein